jgi:DNA-binding transcriptional ArsR family regulator
METGAERLLALAYGNHPKSSSLKPEGRRVLRKLREGPVGLEELMRELNLDPLSPAHRKHFYILLKPLRETGMIATRKEGGRTLYYLSYEGFSQYLRELRKEAEFWLKEAEKEESP